jgi:hypothetical protein
MATAARWLKNCSNKQTNKQILSINNHNFYNYVHMIHSDELEINDTTQSNISASYLDILFNIDSNGRLTTALCDKLFAFLLVK